MSHRICLCDVLIESDRLWTSWTSVGLTSKAFSAAQLPVPRLVGGGWEFFSEKSYSAPETTIPHAATQLTASEDSFILFSLPEVSQKTFFCKPFYRELCPGYHHCSSSISSSCLYQGSQPRHWGTEGQIRTSYPFHAKSRG